MDLAEGDQVAVGNQSSQVPRWLKSHLKNSDLPLIASAVQEIEKKTTGEIVPVVIERSVNIGSARFANFLFWFSTALILDLVFFSSESWWYFLFLQLLALGCFLISNKIRFWFEKFIPDTDEWQAVQIRAEREFFRLGLHKTENASGVLIFVSLFERKVVLLADHGIHSRLQDDAWTPMVAQLTENIKTRSLASGLTQAINSCGELLTQNFPGQKTKRNELSNELVMISVNEK